MKIKTSELVGAALDWAVAKCLATVHEDGTLNGTTMYGWWISGLFTDPNYWIRSDEFNPSTDWVQGGSLLEREKLALTYDAHWHYDPTDPEDNGERWYCELTEPNEGSSHGRYGPTPLVAAMRCYVASRLGDEVEVPEELV